MKRILAVALVALASCGLAHAQDFKFDTGGAVVDSAHLNITATDCTNQLVEDISTGGVGSCKTVTLAGPQFANQGTTTTLLHGNGSGNPTWGAAVSADLNLTTTSCSNQYVTAISSGGVGTCTTDTLAGAYHANQGTGTTVLHGNASGNPSWAAVSLTADVSGITPKANGGFGFAPVTISSCSSTGLGSGGSPGCAVVSGNEHFAVLRLTTGTTGGTPSANGTVTVTLGQTLSAAAGCMALLSNTGGTNWQASGVIKGAATSTTAPQVGWSNAGTALTANTTYDLWLFCNMP